jgi:hypothetical protein
MLDLNDDRWASLKGGYRVQFDPRPLLLKLAAGEDVDAVWHELWDELHHQGDVDEASYAAVPHLVRIYRQTRAGRWNTYAIVAIIELARARGKNPDVPDWLERDYVSAVVELAELGVSEISSTKDVEEIRAMLGILAIQSGARTHGRFLVEYSEEELLDLESKKGAI